MRSADTVVALPVTRDLIRRVARAHAHRGFHAPRLGLFQEADHQAAYERAFHEYAMQRDAEVAECA